MIERIPAVSGSSGKLKIIKFKRDKPKNQKWPGQIFDNDELSYEEAMNDYFQQRKLKLNTSNRQVINMEEAENLSENDREKIRRQRLLEEEKVLRDQKRKLRNQRQIEDSAWKTLREECRREEAFYKMLPLYERRNIKSEKHANDEIWKEKKRVRKLQLERRKMENKAFQYERDLISQQKNELTRPTAWIAILVIVDNCTRQCLGVPMFTAGANVTAKMVSDAFAALLPEELNYLITDRGTHFRAKVIESLEQIRGFKHVLLAPHRPQSNGIAERFVQTLKGYLYNYSWQTPQQLNSLLFNFQDYYNNRPHQGRELKGLSPNKYASLL